MKQPVCVFESGVSNEVIRWVALEKGVPFQVLDGKVWIDIFLYNGPGQYSVRPHCLGSIDEDEGLRKFVEELPKVKPLAGKLRCSHCNHEWIPQRRRGGEGPRTCPKCSRQVDS